MTLAGCSTLALFITEVRIVHKSILKLKSTKDEFTANIFFLSQTFPSLYGLCVWTFIFSASWGFLFVANIHFMDFLGNFTRWVVPHSQLGWVLFVYSKPLKKFYFCQNWQCPIKALSLTFNCPNLLSNLNIRNNLVILKMWIIQNFSWFLSLIKN